MKLKELRGLIAEPLIVLDLEDGYLEFYNFGNYEIEKKLKSLIIDFK